MFRILSINKSSIYLPSFIFLVLFRVFCTCIIYKYSARSIVKKFFSSHLSHNHNLWRSTKNPLLQSWISFRIWTLTTMTIFGDRFFISLFTRRRKKRSVLYVYSVYKISFLLVFGRLRFCIYLAYFSPSHQYIVFFSLTYWIIRRWRMNKKKLTEILLSRFCLLFYSQFSFVNG